MRIFLACLVAAFMGAMSASAQALETATNAAYPLWDLALQHTNAQRFSTLFTAEDVRDHLPTPIAIARAIDWCKQSGITHVFLEVYRDGYRAERTNLLAAKEAFLAAGFQVSGCVTTTRIGKPSTGWASEISCYTDEATQGKLQAIFEYAAGLFDEIIIDDFYFTDCACAQCREACEAQRVLIGDHEYHTPAPTGAGYRCELMLRMSEQRVLAASKQINPKVKVIIKYPQWYDDFQNRGYDVLRETAAFDRIWAGTETRDYNDPKWGGAPPYEGYFALRWLESIGGAKCGGGWYDYLGTSPATYIEQARQTILAGSRESFLFHYGALQPSGEFDVVAGFSSPTGPVDTKALRSQLPELFQVAEKIKDRPILGVAAYKPPNSQPGRDTRVYDYVGMLGIPLAPCFQFPTNAPAAFFSEQALGDKFFAGELADYLKTGRPVLLTDNLARRLRNSVELTGTNVQIMNVGSDPALSLNLTQTETEALRRRLLEVFQTVFKAPNHVGLYLYDHGGWVVENFNGQPAEVDLNGQKFTVTGRGWKYSL